MIYCDYTNEGVELRAWRSGVVSQVLALTRFRAQHFGHCGQQRTPTGLGQWFREKCITSRLPCVQMGCQTTADLISLDLRVNRFISLPPRIGELEIPSYRK